MTRDPSAEDGTLLPELLLDRYRVEGRLGEGGFGQVVRAYDTRLHRNVAIKTLRRALATADLDHYRALEDRFNREAQAGSRVGDHPNLVTVYDLVMDAERTQYLICQFVPGGTLAERIAHGPLFRPDALRLTADAARGLQAAHDAGIVHRDIKPANIFLAADGRAQVGDFGIAQMDHLSGRTQATIGHPGTPLYMSPEQASTTGYVRPETDQYSLGLVLFEMLTSKAYKRLREGEIEGLLTEYPPAVAALIRQMTAPRPDDRYGSMTETIAAITAIERQPASPVAQHEQETERTVVALSEKRRDTPPLADATVRDPLPRRVTPYVSPSPALPVMLPPVARTTAPRQHTRRGILAGIGGLALAMGGTGGVILARQHRSGSGSTASMTAMPAHPTSVTDRATSTQLVGANGGEVSPAIPENAYSLSGRSGLCPAYA
ncbi:MAG: serine/threonine-protein kinase [Thermomicrobiales bacterium]